MPTKTFLLASVLLVPTPASAVDDALDRYNVVWDAPSKDHNGSMPIGNGDVGLNVWVEEGGDLLLLISKTDAWSENCRLLKLGRVRVKLAPNPFADGPFRQELRLRQGEIAIAAGEGEKAVSLTAWVDARRPVVRIEAEGASPLQMQAVLEVWRTERRQLVGKEVNSAYGLHGSPTPVYVYPDTVLEDQQDCIVWRHRNESSIWADNLKLQSLEGFIAKSTDPLLHRTFGGRIEGDNLVSENAATLKSAAPQKRFVLSIYPLCAQTATADAWVEQLDRRVAENRPADLEQDRAAHRAWWNEFWSRSWIRATTSDEVFPGDLKARPLTKNALPLRIGADSAGANRFIGDLPEEITGEDGQPMSPRAHLHIHAVVERQLAADEPRGVVAIAHELEQLGVSRHDVRHEIGSVITEHIWYMTKEGAPFDEDRYMADLRKMIRSHR